MASCICNPELLPSIPSGTGDKGRGVLRVLGILATLELGVA